MSHFPSASPFIQNNRLVNSADCFALPIWVTRFVWLVFAVAGVIAARSGSAAEDGEMPLVQKVQIGFGNSYRLGTWTPVTVMIAPGAQGIGSDNNAPPRLEIEALDGDSVFAGFLGPELSRTPSDRYQLYFRIGRPHSPIRVLARTAQPQSDASEEKDSSPRAALRDTEPTLLFTLADSERPRPIPDTHEWIVEVGGQLNLLESLNRIDSKESDRMTVVALSAKDALNQLPDRWYGYEGVDMVAIVGSDAFDGKAPREEAIEALSQWCHSGGTVLIVCGDGAEQLIGDGAPLARFIPGKFARMRELRQFASIENYAAADQRLDFAELNLRLRVPELTGVRGVTELSESQAGDLPLVVRGSLGFGNVIFVGLDLHKPPFNAWIDRAKFLDKLLQRRFVRQVDTVATQSAASQSKRLGYLDLSGQLRGALDQYEGIKPIPFWSVSLLVVAYICALLPFNYYVCNRWLNRPRLAWVLLPAFIIGSGLLAYELTIRSKGDLLRVNQIDLVDIDAAGGVVRGATWQSLYSPENSTFDLIAKANDLGSTGTDKDGDTPFAWFGLPGNGFGGMSSQAVTTPLFDQKYSIDPSTGQISGVPIGIWSSRTFAGRWLRMGNTAPSQTIQADVRRTFDRLLEGTISNSLAWPLRDGVLLYDRSVYYLGTLEPNQTVHLARNEFQPIDTYLTKRDANATRDAVPPYDRSGNDIKRILEVMTFHRAAGASDYSGLANRHQTWMDLSHELQLGRAVIMGYGPPGTTITVSGLDEPHKTDRHLSIYRFVVPVR